MSSSIPGGLGSVHSDTEYSGSGHTTHPYDGTIRITFHNRTTHDLTIQASDSDVAASQVGQASHWQLELSSDSQAAKRAVVEVVVQGPNGQKVVLQAETKPQAKWFNSPSSVAKNGQREWVQAISKQGQSQWSLLAVQTRPQTQGPPDVHVLLFDPVDLASWMGRIPDNTPLSALTIPGTHESLSRSGYPISACQSSASTTTKQLHDGIRFLDVRVSAKDPNGGDSAQVDPKQQKLYAYHGILDQKIELGQALQEAYDFVSGVGHSETVLVSIKPESDARIMQECFEHNYLHPKQDKWFLEPKIPTLGEARGKLILISRYGSSGDQPGGIHPPLWPNSSQELFEYDLPTGQKVVTQDWYDIGSMKSLEDKFTLIKSLLDRVGSEPQTLGLNFVSSAALPLALPPYAANGALWYKGLNARLRDYVADLHLARSRGGPNQALPLQVTFNLDFYEHEPELIQLLVQSNFVSR